MDFKTVCPTGNTLDVPTKLDRQSPGYETIGQTEKDVERFRAWSKRERERLFGGKK